MAVVSRRAVSGAIATRLQGVTNATGYYGQVGRTVTGTLGVEPQPKSATDLRVRPYYVLYPGVGGPTPDVDLGDTAVDLTQSLQVTCVAGDIDDLLGLVDRVIDRLNRWAPTVTGVVAGPLRLPPGFQPVQLIDRNWTPERLYVPLTFQLTATT